MGLPRQPVRKTKSERQERQELLAEGYYSPQNALDEFAERTGIALTIDEISIGYDDRPIVPTAGLDIQLALQVYQLVRDLDIGGASSERKFLEKVLRDLEALKGKADSIDERVNERPYFSKAGRPRQVTELVNVREAVKLVGKDLSSAAAAVKKEIETFKSLFGGHRERTSWPRTELVCRLLAVRKGEANGAVPAHVLWHKPEDPDLVVPSYGRVSEATSTADVGLGGGLAFEEMNPMLVGHRTREDRIRHAVALRAQSGHRPEAWLDTPDVALILMAAEVELDESAETPILMRWDNVRRRVEESWDDIVWEVSHPSVAPRLRSRKRGSSAKLADESAASGATGASEKTKVGREPQG